MEEDFRTKYFDIKHKALRYDELVKRILESIDGYSKIDDNIYIPKYNSKIQELFIYLQVIEPEMTKNDIKLKEEKQ